MPYRDIHLEQKGPIAILTLNRPDIRNALTGRQMVEEIVDACRVVDNDPSVSVLILTGAGPAFSGGGNIKDMDKQEGMFSGSPAQIRDNYRRGIQQVPLALTQMEVPTIAAVNGPAIGAGCDLACMCDLRIADSKARFGEIFASLGLVPGDGGAFFLPRIVGFSKACELAFTCRIIDAEEALRIGLVSEVTSPEKLMDRCMEIAQEMARQPSRSLRMTKRLFHAARDKTLPEALELSAAFQAICHHTPEHKKAVADLMTKHGRRFKP